jgi:hypothetical protein
MIRVSRAQIDKLSKELSAMVNPQSSEQLVAPEVTAVLVAAIIWRRCDPRHEREIEMTLLAPAVDEYLASL